MLSLIGASFASSSAQESVDSDPKSERTQESVVASGKADETKPSILLKRAEANWFRERIGLAVVDYSRIFDIDASGEHIETRTLAVACRRLLEFHNRNQRLNATLPIRRRLIRLLEDERADAELVSQLVTLGEQLLQIGRTSEARNVLENALSKRPKLLWELRCRKRLAVACSNLDDAPSAEAQWRRIAERAEKSIEKNWSLYSLDTRADLFSAAATARIQLGQTDRANALLTGFAAHLSDIDLPSRQVEFLIKIIQFNRATNNRDRSAKAGHEAAEICRKLLKRFGAPSTSKDTATNSDKSKVRVVNERSAAFVSAPQSLVRFQLARVERELALIDRQDRNFDLAKSHLTTAIKQCEDSLNSEIARMDLRQHERTNRVHEMEIAAQTQELLIDLYTLAGELRDGAIPLLLQRLKAVDPKSQSGRSLRLHLALLHRITGSSDRARDLLVSLRAEHGQLRQPQPESWLRVLNQLASVEFEQGQYSVAEALCAEAHELTSRFTLRESTHVAESFNNLGQVLVYQGKYADGVAALREADQRCRRLALVGDGLRATVLLNLAMSHKSQGQLGLAVRYCNESLQLHRLMYGPESLSVASMYNALAGLLSSQGHFRAAAETAGRSLSICLKHDHSQHTAVATARHFVALDHLANSRLDSARQEWHQVLEIQQNAGQVGRVIRTLTYLATVARLCDDAQLGITHLQEAIQLQERTNSATPVVEFLAMSTLGELYLKTGDVARARRALEQAVTISESPRAATYGGDVERAEFFSQFGSAFDSLFQLELDAQRFDSAFQVAERARNRTFLDQMAAAKIDPREGVDPGLLSREREVSSRLNKLRLQARVQADDGSQSAKDVQRAGLRRSLATAKRDFVKIRGEILNSSPAYRYLLEQRQNICSLDEVRQQLVQPGQVMLYYHLTRDAAYVLLVPPPGQPVSAIPLQVSGNQLAMLSTISSSSEAASALASLKNSEDRLVRGLGLKPVISPDRRERDEPGSETDASVRVMKSRIHSVDSPDSVLNETTMPISHELITTLVREYVTSILEHRLGRERGLGAETVVSTDRPASHQHDPVTLAADILLPKAVRNFVTRSGASRIWIVPDGPLHQLPFEALVLNRKPGESVSKPAALEPRLQFVLDEWPPIVYLPSAAIALERPAVAPAELTNSSDVTARNSAATLLTVGDPVYSQPAQRGAVSGTLPASEDRDRFPTTSADSLGLTRRAIWMQSLPQLPGTARECQRLRDIVGADSSKILLGRDATESKVKALIPRFSIVHFAAHGLVDENFDNLFGGIALTPPESASAGDGILSLYEIHQLPLSGCRLAVLSACETNIGPNRPMEASSSLSRAFLSAGAHSVVASLWSVSDESTAVLMSEFLKRYSNTSATSVAFQKKTDAVSALHAARRKIRESERWSAPWYWAPFIISGTPDVERN